MVVTSVDVDRDAIAEIKSLLNLKSDREVINEGIQLLLARARQKKALKRMSNRSFNPEQLDATVIQYPL